MHRSRNSRIWILSLLIALFVFWTQPAWAQFNMGFGSGGASKVQVSAQFTVGADNAPARLFVTATSDPGWYIYSITQKGDGPIRTEIKLDEGQGVRLLRPFQAYPAPEEKVEELFGDLLVESHHGTVVWHAPIQFDSGVAPANMRIKGAVRAQACSDSACLPPQDYPFTAAPGPGEEVPSAQLADTKAATLTDTKPTTFDPAELSANLQKKQAEKSLPVVLMLAFVGGVILNLMPCVLPVIGLKVMSFVTQAGESRGRAFLLNVIYSVGIISVFLVLAGLAVGFGLGWGQLFTYVGFNVVMAAVVFAMGLSFLGVWEIPIPGFVGSGKSAEIQQQEGLSAAFLKGVITTVLATPCTGPFMASALAWAVAQPPGIVFAVFLAIGLGMSSPYLLIGAFPQLIRFLPKPGGWMDTFKQIMGFFLLGTVVFLLSFLDWPYVVPTVGLLFAIWAGLWWFNRTPVTAPATEKWRAWLETTAFVGVAWLLLFPGLDSIVPGQLGFHGLYDEMNERFLTRVGAPTDGPGLKWQAYTNKEDFSAIVGTEGRTVLVNFTADWCLTCKALEASVLNAPEVVAALQQDDVVLLKADYTRRPPEVERFLNILGSKQVPIVAIFSPDTPNDPIVFRDGYTQQMILDALETARPRG